MSDKLSISLGTAPYNWGRKRLLEFYLDELADVSADEVYVGNNICHQREILTNEDLKNIAQALNRQGKKGYFSTLTLCTKAEEVDGLNEKCRYFDGVEVNMIGFLNQLKDTDKEIVLGPYLNLYNWKSAAYMQKFHPVKLVASFEIPLDSIADIADKSGIPVEVMAWGNISTALSWRCYTARAVNRSRENCGKICFEYPEGMLLKSVENEDLFRIDGLQVLSAKTHSLIEYLPLLAEKQISSIRIYPSMENTGKIVDVFRQVIAAHLTAKTGGEQLVSYAPHGVCNGWFLGKPGWEYVAA
ncbi:MAG: U32 family peptidase [Candidatus Schekmanbacteria bacterium]|nr:U32 family peptidase [Candidatus Schekmanbacteria bacterium]